MSKAKKPAPKPLPIKKAPRPPMDPATKALLRRIALHMTLAMVLLGACGAAFHYIQRYVEHRVAFPAEPPKVVLKDRPVWMSDFLAEQIGTLAKPAGTHSSFDHQLLVDVTAMLKTSPWVRKVNAVRRVYGQKPGDTLEVDCEFRAPVALVHWGDYFWLVDGDGVKLPEQFTSSQVPRILIGQDRKVNIRIIDGVRQPPPESGQAWLGEDLRAGLDMVKLLFGRPYTEELVKVDVGNFGGRERPKEAQLVLVTRYATEVRWGQPVNSKDFFIETSPALKLEYLRLVYEQKKRVDGNHPWIDIRFAEDAITYPSAEGGATADVRR